MKKNLAFLIFNFIGLQVTWAACAYGATHSIPQLGVYIGLSYIILHFIFSKYRMRDLKIMFVIGILGIIIDSILTLTEIITFPNYENEFAPTPYWLMGLWLVFALMVPYSLYWLKRNLIIASIAGAIGGSFSYFLGHKLGAVQLADPLTMSVGIYFICWGIIFPVALKIVEHLSPSHLKNNVTQT